MKYFFLIAGSLTFFILNFSEALNTNDAKENMDAKPFAVVELFTSEGCYSCPPADRLLSKIIDDAREKDRRVFALAFHVDYWDRLGWKDAFSNKEFSDRQRNYAQAFKSSSIYTPQMVVNGIKEFIGSESETAFKFISAALERPPYTEIEISTAYNRDMDMVTVDYKLSGLIENSNVNIALVERNIVREIGHGENGGKTLRHDNVVRAFEINKATKTGSQVLTIPKNTDLKNTSVFVYVQDKTSKVIVGAEKIDLN